MIWFLATRFTAWLWNLPKMPVESKLGMAIISTLEIFTVIIFLCFYLCDKLSEKNQKDTK